MYHKRHGVNQNGGGSYVDSPDKIKSQKATINPIIKKITNVFNMLKKSH